METPSLPQEAAHRSEQAAIANWLAEDDERRICQAHQLHKQVAGNLVAGLALLEMLRLEAAKTAPSGEEARLSDRLGEILRETLNDVRWLVEEQYPPLLKSFGLNATLQELARMMAARNACVLDLELPPEDLPLSLTEQLNLYRMVEMLYAHAVSGKATRTHLALTATDENARWVFTSDSAPAHWLLSPVAPGLELIVARGSLLRAEMESLSRKGIPQFSLSIPLQSSAD